jgi:hypothetical protein
VFYIPEVNNFSSIKFILAGGRGIKENDEGGEFNCDT